jgi:nitrogen fixation/metabolism regulation signal transduction histidine kinase
MVRVVAYWLFCLLASALMACCWIAWLDRPASSGELFTLLFRHYGPVFVATLILLPLVIVDTLRLTNRFVGPVYRLRRALQEAADGKLNRPLKFRDDDFWRDVAEDFNRAVGQVPENDTATR